MTPALEPPVVRRTNRKQPVPPGGVWTDEALMALRKPLRYELMDGESIIMQPAGGEHGWMRAGMVGLPWTWNRERNLGRVFEGQTGFRLTPDLERGNVLSPDGAFVPRERLAGMLPDPKKFLLGAPDFACEVLSPRDTYAYMERKKDKHITHGCRLLWLADPLRREVHVWTPAGKQAVLGEDATLDGGDVLPGFTLSVRQIFE